MDACRKARNVENDEVQQRSHRIHLETSRRCRWDVIAVTALLPPIKYAVGCCWVGWWLGYLSGARCRFAYGPTDAIATCSNESRLVIPFWYQLTRVVLDNGPLNECCCCCLLYLCPHVVWNGDILFFNRSFFHSFFFLSPPNVRGHSTYRQPL